MKQKKQRDLLFYSRGYNEFRKEIEKLYGRLNPGDCWVSASCFLPKDGQKIVAKQLEKASKKGKGTLKWFPNTVIKDLELSADGKIIESAIAIQHSAKPNQPSLNSKPLSTIFEDIYTYTESSNLDKSKVLGIDHGLNNWLSSVSNIGKSFIIDGKKIKSQNQCYNKQIAKLKTNKPQGFWNDELAFITEKRNRQMRDNINKCARFLVNWCLIK